MCTNVILSDLQKSLVNLKYRRQHELSRHKMLLGKLSRTDVQENMDDLLSEGEKNEMAHMNRMIRILKTSEMQLNEAILNLKFY